MRTEQTYFNNAVDYCNVSICGIKEKCVWNELETFHVVYYYSKDMTFMKVYAILICLN